MLNKILRKASQIWSDPTLRNWLIGRLFGRWHGEPAFTAHCPSYLINLLPLPAENPTEHFSSFKARKPQFSLQIDLPCESITLNPDEEINLFNRKFNDIETKLALHRFAWLTNSEEEIPIEWVAFIWQAWAERYSNVDNSWVWHPYTASERAINILKFMKRFGVPGSKEKTLSILTKHATAIANKLEYYGDHHTSNHLANNGRGLFLIGLMLGLKRTTDLGGQILIEEAKRIFHSSGILREGSSHYHILLSRNYDEVAKAAKKHNRYEASTLRTIADKARAAAKMLILPRGLPLVGDISPDQKPAYLIKQLGLMNIKNRPSTKEISLLRGAGWYRKDIGPFSALWHAAPEGWSQMPGHGHQDIGSFELHSSKERIFVDPGRGNYGEIGEAALYRSAAVHNTLTIDGTDPYPPNKPYYCDKFRRTYGGPYPQVEVSNSTLKLTHFGYERIKGVKQVIREWTFINNYMYITDTVNGQGKHKIDRILITPLRTEHIGNNVLLYSANSIYRLISESIPTINVIPIWKSYGYSFTGSAIVYSLEENLPWSGKLHLERVQ